MRDSIVASIEAVFTPSHEPLPESVQVSDQYRAAHNHAAGINPRHAIGVLKSGRIEVWGEGQERYILAAKAVEIDRPYVQLIYANTRLGNPVTVSAGWRMYDVAAEASPTEMFAELLTRHGLDVRIGDRAERFFALDTIESGDMSMMPVEPPSGAFTVSGAFRKLPGGYLQVTWAFCTDDEAYGEAVRAARG